MPKEDHPQNIVDQKRWLVCLCAIAANRCRCVKNTDDKMKVHIDPCQFVTYETRQCNTPSERSEDKRRSDVLVWSVDVRREVLFQLTIRAYCSSRQNVQFLHETCQKKITHRIWLITRNYHYDNMFMCDCHQREMITKIADRWKLPHKISGPKNSRSLQTPMTKWDRTQNDASMILYERKLFTMPSECFRFNTWLHIGSSRVPKSRRGGESEPRIDLPFRRHEITQSTTSSRKMKIFIFKPNSPTQHGLGAPMR